MTSTYKPSPYGVESDIRTLEAVQRRQASKVETAFIQRTDSAVKMADWELQVAILDYITADLQEARRQAS